MDEKLLKVLRGEHWQDNLGGFEWTDELREAIMRVHAHEVKIVRLEEQVPKLKVNINFKPPYSNMIDAACVAVLKSETDHRIKEIAFNKPDDLFTDNFGTIFASLIHGVSPNPNTYTVYDAGNVARTINSSQGPYWNMYGGDKFHIKLGASSTAAARSQYNIITPFVTAPESNYFPCGTGSYAIGSGIVSFGNIITAGGSGTINEISWYEYMQNQYYIMLTRDVLGSGVAFVQGNPLVGTYAISI